MMKTFIKILIILILILNVLPELSGQNDSIIIKNDRRMIKEKLEESNYYQIKVIFKDLLEKDKSNRYLALYPSEKNLLYYLTDEYKPIIGEVLTPDSVIYKMTINKIYPKKDTLFECLLKRAKEQRKQILEKVENTKMDKIDKEFLKLYFDFLITFRTNSFYGFDYYREFYSNYIEVNQDTLNKYADIFLKNFPNSKYEDYIRLNIEYKYVLSDFGYGYNLFLGYSTFTNMPDSKFTSAFIYGVAGNLYYKKIAFNLKMLTGSCQIKDSIQFINTTLHENTKIDFSLFNLSIGYSIINKDYFSCTPYAGISYITFSPNKHELKLNPEYENIEFGCSNYTFGISMDYYLKPRKRNINEPNDDVFMYIRFRYGYNKQFTSNNSDFIGDTHYFTLGIGVLFQKVVRVF